MPTPDPGFAAYMLRTARAVKPPIIDTTEAGWAWRVDGEVHELTIFGAVHVNKEASNG